MPEVGPIPKEEGPWNASRSLESSAPVTQAMVMLINDVASNETDNLVGKKLKVFEASLISVTDAQIERESILDGVYQGTQTEDIASQQTKERFKRKSGKQINIGRRKFGGTFGKYRNTTRLDLAYPKGITISNIRNQPDFTQQLFSDQQYQTSELPADIKFELCQVNSAQINWPIDGRLIHFLDIWKLIKADILITREQIQRKRSSSWIAETERTARGDCGGGIIQSTKMDQSLLCNSKEGQRKMEEENGLLLAQLTSPLITLFNGGHIERLITSTSQGFHDKDRSEVRLSLYSSGQGIQTLPRIHLQQYVLPVQSYVFRGQIYPTDLLQNSSFSYQIHQRSIPGQNNRILRRYHHFTPESRRTEHQEIINHQHPNQLWIQDLNAQICVDTNDVDRIFWLENRFKSSSDINDAEQIEENDIDEGKMEKDCNQLMEGQRQVRSKFHRVFELYEALFKRGEIFWWMAVITSNIPIQATIVQPHAILATDANQTHWGSTLKLFNHAQEVWYLGKWSQNWHLTSSNQREAAAILCALLRSETFLKERQIKSLKIQTDNLSASFNINRGSAAVVQAKKVDRTLDVAENFNLQLHAFHIPGETNKIPDSLSRLATSGDYSLLQEVFEEAKRALKTRLSIDRFSNRQNRKLKQFVCITADSWAVGQDCLLLPWKGELPYIHPPIPLIQATLNNLASRYVYLGKSVKVLKTVGRMRKAKKYLPPGKMLVVKLVATEARSSSNGFYQRGSSLQTRLNKSMMDSTASEADIDKEQENLRSSELNPERSGKIQQQ
ncbi:MAG: hypothetical protein EZS28_008992 [Streblomastix strix]|uniref:Uncharacterized protein n=1 Tax=Streblomastix strix TaxID=222440 RepID=A0A5J4WKU6_9EUKA|nr:MAG: hypothetical protein EZS28_008992 [Streblomastix strix]